MKKTISVITLIPRSSRFYAEQVQALFGQWAQVHSYSTGDRSVEGIVESDLYLLSTVTVTVFLAALLLSASIGILSFRHDWNFIYFINSTIQFIIS